VIKFIFFFISFSFVANAQRIKDNLEEKHQVINSFFSKMDTVYLYDKTINRKLSPSKMHSYLKTFRSWDEAAFSLENSQFKKIDLKTIVNQKYLNRIIDSVFLGQKINLTRKNIAKNIFFIKEGESLERKPKYSISLPVLYKSKNGNLYSFIYVDNFYNPLAGYGALYLFIKKGTKWVHIYSYGIWIS